MHKLLPFAHRIKKPFEYVPAASTDIGPWIRREIEKSRQAEKAKKAKQEAATNVRPMRRQKVAA